MAIGCMALGLFIFRSLDHWNAIYLYALLGGAVVFNATDIKLRAKEERIHYQASDNHEELWRTRMLAMTFDLASQASQFFCLAYIFAFFLRNV